MLGRSAVPRTKPRLVLLDPANWDALEWLGAVVRRRGMQVVRVVPAPAKGPKVMLDRMLFGGCQALLDPDSGGSVSVSLDALLAEPTVDAQGPEVLVDHLRRAGHWPQALVAQRVPDPVNVPLLYDKLAMDKYARTVGVDVPQAWAEAPPGVFPLVVKGAAGSGGSAVVIVNNDEELASAFAQLRKMDCGDTFLQEFIDGPILNYGGVVRQGRVLASGVYRSRPAPGAPQGPPEWIELVDHPDIEAQVSQLCSALDYSGFVSINFMGRPDGSAAMIDFNPRVFGSWLAMQQCGVALLEAYLSLFDLGPEPAPHKGRFGATVRVRHAPRAKVDNWAQWRAEGRMAVRSLADSAELAGPAYVGLGTARAVTRLAQSAVGQVRRKDDVRG